MKSVKKISTVAFLLLALGIFSCEDPNAPASEYTVTVTGQTVRVNKTGLDSVVVTLSNPFRRDTVSSDGSFSFTFTSTEKNEITTLLSFRHLGLLYRDTSVTVKYGSSSKSVGVGEVEMRGVTTAQDSVVTGRPSARAGAIFFVGSLLPSIAIKGSGGTEITNLLFEVRDSLGIPVDQSNATTVRFVIKSSSLLGVQLNLDSARTATNGQVAVQLRSGSKTGMAQVQAVLKSDTTIKSAIASIPIHGGLPDSSHFSIGVEKVNLPGGVKFGQSTLINVLVGDKFGNPVQPGTPISFTTTGGIVDPFGVTSSDGRLVAELKTGNPIPPNGIATVTAEIPISSNISAGGKGMKNKSFLDSYRKNIKNKSTASTFSRSVDVLFSGQSVITFNDNNFVIPVQSERTFNFTVADPLGHPLSSGTSIKVLGLGLDSVGVTLTGDIDKLVPDTKDPSYTQFSFVVSDKRTTNLSQSKQISLAIEVTSPNGNIKRNITGYLGFAPVDTSGVPFTARQPAQIAFISASEKDIFVSGVGGTETSTLTYEVRDSLGVPIDFTRRVGATFGLQFIPNSFTPGGTPPSIIPALDSSDNQGRVRVTIISGTQAGIVQVITSIQVSQTKIITSQPVKVSVHAGFPDQNHFTLAAKQYNFPGLDRAFQTLDVTVGVTDQHSNPVIEGTAVYLNSSHGTITTGNITDGQGFVRSVLFSSNPYPIVGKTLPGLEPGYTRIYARTIGKDGVQVLDSILVLWTGAPIITNTGIDTFTVPNGGSRGPFTFSVRDRFNHPMSSGTTIIVTATAGSVDGHNEVPINFDTFNTGEGITTFTVYIEDDDDQDTDPPLSASMFVKVTHPVYGSYTLKLASGTVD